MDDILAHPWVTKSQTLEPLEFKKQLAKRLNDIRIEKNKRKQEEQLKRAV